LPFDLFHELEAPPKKLGILRAAIVPGFPFKYLSSLFLSN